MHEVLPDISGARAEGQARFSGQLPALQPADHLRVRFGRPKHPKGIVERKTNHIDARSSTQGASQLEPFPIESKRGFRFLIGRVFLTRTGLHSLENALARSAGHGPHTVSSVQPRPSNSMARRDAPAIEKNSSS